ncbi:uncharacterized protein [Fopius arisanus]|uniref:Gustatory receptor n=1 Tax=Fopius arisanus TaxID=64838 RepID=A0A9R1U1V4_9HYME|nr:PREDICTED: uncharacterized protein LOC105267166 [Fopius arisanus]
MEEFVEDGSYPLIVLKDSPDYHMYKTSNQTLVKKMMALMKPVDLLPRSYQEGFNEICTKRVAFYTHEAIRRAMVNKIPCEITAINTGKTETLGMALPRGSEYRGLINYHINGKILEFKKSDGDFFTGENLKTLWLASEVEDTLDGIGVKKDPQLLIICQFSVFLLWIFMIFGINLSTAMWVDTRSTRFDTHFVNTCCLMHPVHINSLLELNYYILIRFASHRYKSINEFLKNLILSNANKQLKSQYQHKLRIRTISVNVERSFSEDDIKRKIQVLKHVHLELRKLTQRLGKSYSPQIIFLMVSSFFVITWMLYSIYCSGWSVGIPQNIRPSSRNKHKGIEENEKV